MDITGRCRNEGEFGAVKFALKEAGYLLGFVPERNTIVCQNNPEASKIIKKHAPSGLTRVGMGFI